MQWTTNTRRHSGAMRSIEPGISRFRVWSFGPSRNDERPSLPIFLPAGQHRRDVALQHLLHQVEGVDDLADLRNAAVAKGVEGRDVELHDPLVAALAEEYA